MTMFLRTVPPSYRLYYFNLRARAEPIRILFALAGVDYEDIRFELSKWPILRDSTPWWQVPMLEVDGKVLAQTCAIYQYLAKKFGYNGKDDWEAAKIAEFICVVDDIFKKLDPFHNAQGVDAKREAIEKIAVTDIIPYFTRLEQCLVKNGTGFFVGDSMTIADITIYMTLEYMIDREVPGVENGFPKLQELADRIEAVPKIRNWILTRPKSAEDERLKTLINNFRAVL